jgi:hypothetical protein
MRFFAHLTRLIPLPKFMLGLGCACMMVSAAAATETPAGKDADALTQFLAERRLAMPWGVDTQKALSLSTQLSLNAMGLIGVPYIWGGAETTLGLDCSGLVQSVYQQTANIALPRNTTQQAANTQVISADDLRPGDLVFFNTLNRPFSHVGIYVGNNRFVHAPKPGANVRISNMTRAYWANRFDGARRAITADAKLSSMGLSNE